MRDAKKVYSKALGITNLRSKKKGQAVFQVCSLL